MRRPFWVRRKDLRAGRAWRCRTVFLSVSARDIPAMESRKRHFLRNLAVVASFATTCGLSQIAFAEKPSGADALNLAPVQLDVDYDKPAAKDAEKATVQNETIGGISGWVVRG